MKKLYILVRDGELLPDTHIFCFKDPLTAVLTLYLFSVTFASKDLKIYCIGEIDNTGIIIDSGYSYFCDYHNGINIAQELLQDKEHYADNPITIEYLQSIMSDVDKVIKEKFIGDDDEQDN